MVKNLLSGLAIAAFAIATVGEAAAQTKEIR